MGAKNQTTVRRRKQNNKGISLVELIVSITILSIIIVPFLHAFLTATNTSAKAKRIAQATEIGRNIMEGLEPYRFKQIAYQFNYPQQGFTLVSGVVADSSNVGELNAVLDASGTETGSYAGVIKAEDLPDNLTNPEDSITSSIIKKESGSLTYTLKEKDKYYFKLQNISANGVYYDALVAINPGKYSTMADPSNPNEDTDGINTIEFASVKQMTLHDGVSMYRDQNNKSDVITNLQNAYNDAQRSNNEHWVDVELTPADISRSVVVDVYNSGLATLADVSYQYSYANGLYVYPVNPNGTSFSFSIFDNSENTDCDLQNVYLFLDTWNPSGNSDVITINNQIGRAINFYIVEQKDDTDADTGYRPNVRLNQTGTEKSSICTNLNIDENHYYFNGLSSDQARENMVITGLTDKKRENRMYDISVTIYPSGSFAKGLENSESIITLTGGMLD
ncbi:MAG: type II secretion system protein [Lachnospiraceae bacterium]|nr:type II secretion system protein [Lachnospiraceae bacterium]MDY5521805.1 type II secretion system protein [Agathobacter sp.]